MWGQHLVLDCKACNNNVLSKEHLTAFVKELVEKIDMKAYGEPQLVHFAAHDPKAGGFTLVQLIETSAITGHFVDSNHDAYIDIFSCKPFDVDTAIAVVYKYLEPEALTSRTLIRQA